MSNSDTSSGMAVVNPATIETVVPANVEPLLLVRSFSLTDRGQLRPINEDQFLVAELTKTLRVHGTSFSQPQVQHSADQNYLFVVADGMSGHAGGERASALAVDTVESFIMETFQWFGSRFPGTAFVEIRRERNGTAWTLSYEPGRDEDAP